jgi:hypothetical protein
MTVSYLNECGNLWISFLLVFTCCTGLVSEKKKTAWPESASELYRPSDRHLSAKLLPTFADRWCHVVSVTDPYDRNLAFLGQI